MSVPDRPFQPSVMFEGKASSLWNVASEMCFTQAKSSLASKHSATLDMVAMDKHSSLL